MGSFERSFDNGVRRAVTDEPGRSIARARMTAIGAERKSITRSRASAQRRLRTSKLPLFDF